MLKTQISKAFYLCLFYFVVSSFAPAAHYTVAISDNGTAEEIPAPAATSATMVYAAPKVKLNRQALQFANHYIKTSEEDLVSIKKRSATPFSIMDAVFSRYGLPV